MAWDRLHSLVAVLLGACSLHANAQVLSPDARPPASQPVAGVICETIWIERGDAKFACYLARPETRAADKPLPGLILIHEWYGLNDWVKQQAVRFAERGYVALAVDLYRGEVATDGEHAHELMRGLPDERAVADLQAAFDWLSKHEAVRGRANDAAASSKDGSNASKIGAIGWCMGGGFALKLAIAEPRLDAAVICYGRPVTDVEQLKKIKCPLLGIWGATDRGIDVEPFKKALDDAKVKATHHVYPGAGHAFLNENNKRGYNKEQAEKAWKQIDKFLADLLKSS